MARFVLKVTSSQFFVLELIMEYVLIAIFLLVVIASIFASKFTDNDNPYPFNAKKSLLSQVEVAFLQLLEKAVGDDYKVVSRVKLVDVLEFKNGVSNKTKRAALAKAQGKQLDFALVDKNTLKVVAAVDLVNNATQNGHKAQRDWFVSGALESAGIPHVRIKVKAGYKPSEVRQAIMFKLGKPVPKSAPIIRRPKRERESIALSPSQVKTQSTALAQI